VKNIRVVTLVSLAFLTFFFQKKVDSKINSRADREKAYLDAKAGFSSSSGSSFLRREEVQREFQEKVAAIGNIQILESRHDAEKAVAQFIGELEEILRNRPDNEFSDRTESLLKELASASRYNHYTFEFNSRGYMMEKNAESLANSLYEVLSEVGEKGEYLWRGLMSSLQEISR
jgi:hypothetical protein